MALINTGREARKDRIAELQAEVERINRAQTRRRVEATAAFCREWSLEVKKWPTEIQEGVISFPAIGELPETEVTEIFAKTAESPPAVDPAQGGLDALRTELERETLMDFYDPSTALSGLLAVAQRAST